MASGSKRRFPRFSFNAPVVLSFTLLCIAAQILNMLTRGGSNRALFSVYPSSALNPLTYLRLVLHVIGHADWDHLFSNMLYFLILGPMLEEKYGSKNLIYVMLAVAVVTGVLSIILFPHVRLLGASGIVFAFILLSSITAREEGTIPLTFVLVAVLYLGQQIYEGIFVHDNVSQITHIAGGAVGSCLGFILTRSAGRKGRG